jgi:transposase
VPHPTLVRRDTIIVTESTLIVAGADTHADTIHLAAISMTGAAIGDREFPTTRAGYAAAIRFLTSLGQVERIGVEGTASYGAGFTRTLTAAGIEVVEVTRAVKSTRRLKGKSDPLDAYSAARTALAGDGLATPKDDTTAGLRALHIARRSAVKHRTAAINQIKAMVVSAPDAVREKYRGLTTLRMIEAIARCRPDAQADPWAQSVLTAAKMLAQRVQFLETQAEALEAQIDAFVAEANPGLRAAYGVGSDTAAQLMITAGANPHRLHSEAAFAALCGVAPVPASSGKTNRHRLCRGGDRAANNALFRIALVRMSHHQPTKSYVQRQLALGHTRMEILRKLKRAIAREIFKLLTRQIAVPEYRDLRPARQAKNITVTAAANHFGVWPTVISRLERGLQRDDAFADTYRNWLKAA